jgi:carbonic anhydrase
MKPSWLPEERASTPRTVVLACADENACAAAWKPLLRDHAVVLRTPGGDGWSGPDSALAALLRTQPVERIIVLGHTPCRASEQAALEPMQNTAAIAAFCRFAQAARTLAAQRAAGQLTAESFRAKQDTLVRRANLEACAELHHALQRGTVEVLAAVYDSERDRVELLDGACFRALGPEELEELISRSSREQRVARDESGWYALHGASAAQQLECSARESC